VAVTPGRVVEPHLHREGCLWHDEHTRFTQGVLEQLLHTSHTSGFVPCAVVAVLVVLVCDLVLTIVVDCWWEAARGWWLSERVVFDRGQT
jgi:hypothetical protein